MATIVNIFGKLYTFLRRPQPDNENQDQNTESTAETSVDVKKESRQEDAVDNVQVPGNCGVVSQKKVHLEKVMTESAASSDWEHIPDLLENQQVSCAATDTKNGEDDQFAIQPHLLNCSTGTDIDAVYTENVTCNLEDNRISKENQDSCATPDSDMSVKTQEVMSSKQEAEEASGITEAGDDEERKEKSKKSHKKDGKTDRESEKKDPKKESDVKVCKFYRRGQKCWKGKSCKFLHGTEKMCEESKSIEVFEKVKQLNENEFESYADFVSKSTDLQLQIEAKDLFYKLGYQKGADTTKVGELVIGQYELAKSRNNWPWVKEARYYAELFFAPDWIDQNLPHKDQRSNRKNRPRRKEKYNRNEGFENPSGMCKDFRLKENPDLQTISANAAGDNSSKDDQISVLDGNIVQNAGDVSCGDRAYTGKHENVDDFITDYTEQVIQEAMKMAISDGLSESAILEVIEDVTSADRINTPYKRIRPARVDLSRTPRSRPEQLALGFNYHSDLVVKQSPKTVKGEIIPLDTLPQPRERPEQLAIGFNYLAEQLVKESPKSETGEVIIPGVVSTPRRLARDQLAIGFNYHSDLIAKDSPRETTTENGHVTNDLHAMNKKNDMVTLMNGNGNCCNENYLNTGEVGRKVKSAKRSISDTFAVGFSYNSDQVNLKSLDELNGNVSNGDSVSCLVEEAVISEGRNVVEVANEIPVTGLPAGSVW